MKTKFKTLAFALGSLLFSGCATALHTQVFNDIHEGDSKDKIMELFGEPKQFQPSYKVEGAQVWIYQSKADVCAIVLKDDKVINKGCEKDPNYRNPAAAFAQGFSDGYNKSNQKHLNCTTTNYGGTAQTSCN